VVAQFGDGARTIRFIEVVEDRFEEGGGSLFIEVVEDRFDGDKSGLRYLDSLGCCGVSLRRFA
jgi:hypothetical protein